MKRVLEYKVDPNKSKIKPESIGSVSENDTVYLNINIEILTDDSSKVKVDILGEKGDEDNKVLIEQKDDENVEKEGTNIKIKLKGTFVSTEGLVSLNIIFADEEGTITIIGPYFYVNKTFEGEIVEDKETIDTLKEIKEEAQKLIKRVDDKLSEINPEELKGEQGDTWMPNVSNEGELSWVKNNTDNPPTPVNIMGPEGKQGLQGKDGEIGPQGIQGESGLTPHIGDNGNWFLGDEDTGKPSKGKDGNGEIILDYVHDSNEVIEISEIVYDTATFITKENHGLKNDDPVMLVYGKGFLEKFDTRVVPTELKQESTVFAVSDVTANSFKIMKRISSSSGIGFSRFTNSSYIDVSKFHFEKAPGLLELELVKKYKNISIEVFTVFSYPFEIKFEKFISGDRGYREKFDPLVNRVKGNIFTKIDINSTKDITIIVAESNINVFNNSSDVYFSRNYYGHKSGFSTELKYIDKFTLDFGIQVSGGAYLPNGTRIKVRNLGGVEDDRN
ncbi:hypothetical protein K5V21_03555 [Clostridium sardiniense]|uniref:BppU N-terminal domain-containing protein n=1 Tax=Clostridium sardiniense TaxID=29369 RepID=A0ABS7KV37_CLOSR|nr:hypothetical protein [Clostridium sardiniense]MBY0754527.1 hypothetical protein [Clostridium sardiniense]MDQ0460877.1 hypothetical protein [Clostridium sardiniense]